MNHIVCRGAALLCALLLVCFGFAACDKTPAEPDAPATDATTTVAEETTTTTVTRPTVNLVDATGSSLIGEWTVKAEKSAITALKFNEDGTVVITTANGVLGGSFVENGDQLSISTTSSTIEGTFTVDGDTIVLTTENDTLTMTKVK